MKSAIDPVYPPLRWQTTFLYQQGQDALKMQFDLICEHIPVNSYISFSSDTDGPSPTIELNKTKVTNDLTFTAGISSQVPSNYEGNITFNLYTDEALTDKSYVEMKIGYLEGQLTQFAAEQLEVVKVVQTSN